MRSQDFPEITFFQVIVLEIGKKPIGRRAYTDEGNQEFALAAYRNTDRPIKAGVGNCNRSSN
jgi:hypothetical protein